MNYVMGMLQNLWACRDEVVIKVLTIFAKYSYNPSTFVLTVFVFCISVFNPLTVIIAYTRKLEGPSQNNS